METLEQFSARMGEVEKDDELSVGNPHRGHSRAVFKFEGQYCYLEQIGYSTFGGLGWSSTMRAIKTALAPEPRDYWWTSFEEFGKERCERIAKHYGGRINETPYGEDGWFYFSFHEPEDGFDALMRLVFDRHTGEYEKLFGKVEVQDVTS